MCHFNRDFIFSSDFSEMNIKLQKGSNVLGDSSEGKIDTVLQ